MKVCVKLFGTLPNRFSEYDSDLGIEIELADGARLKDLLVCLKLAESDGGFATVGGRVLKSDDTLYDGITVYIFQRVFGG